MEFADTDMARIVHFSRYFAFMEAAEHEVIRHLLGGGRQPHFEYQGREVGWPRVKATCEYRSPARLGDVLDIRVFVKRKGTKSLTWGFELSIEGRAVADGEITALCCFVDGPELQAIPIPPFLAEQLEEAPTRLINA
ncbi:MAG: acyl-CoA thioesterase [Holophagales bacterium]|nr:acyl-CoA thioesterase [Holophagales bacterium]